MIRQRRHFFTDIWGRNDLASVSIIRSDINHRRKLIAPLKWPLDKKVGSPQMALLRAMIEQELFLITMETAAGADDVLIKIHHKFNHVPELFIG